MSHGLAIKKPTLRECKICMDMAMSCNANPGCNNCPKESTVEILQFVNSFIHSYAICKTSDNQLIQVDLHNLRTISN